MNGQEYNELLEASRRRKLTQAESIALEEFLSANPGSRADWAIESQIHDLLDRLPAAPPVSSNFTAQVMQAIEREQSARAREKTAPAWHAIFAWLPRAAIAVLVLGFTFVGYHQYEANNSRTALAKDAAALSTAVAAPNPELVKDLDPILRLPDPQPKVDVELIALMQ